MSLPWKNFGLVITPSDVQTIILKKKKKNRHGLNLPGVINGVCSVLNSEQGTRSQTLMVLFQPPTLF